MPKTKESQLDDATPVGNLLGFDMVNQYRCAIKKVLCEQRDRNQNRLIKEDVDLESIKRLIDNVKRRKDRVAKANFKERE